MRFGLVRRPPNHALTHQRPVVFFSRCCRGVVVVKFPGHGPQGGSVPSQFCKGSGAKLLLMRR
jgi:hypothetical protein